MRSLGETLWLADTRRKVRDRPAERHAEVRRWWAIARARLRVAERLDPRTEIAAILPLLRDGLLGLAGAAIAATEGAPEREDVTSVESAWTALERVWPALGARGPLAEFAAARTLLLEPLAVDAPAPAGAAEGVLAAERLARCIERAIVPRGRRALAARAIAQVGALAAVAIGAVALLVPPLFGPPDLAREKPVRVSSNHPDSVAPPGGAWLVDGRIQRIYGWASANEQDPWMLVDSERASRIRRIVVYNRGDGWLTDCLPLEALVGEDATKLHRVAMRETLFTQFSPWVIHLDESARFVKLKTHAHAACALSEVEVYSR